MPSYHFIIKKITPILLYFIVELNFYRRAATPITTKATTPHWLLIEDAALVTWGRRVELDAGDDPAAGVDTNGGTTVESLPPAEETARPGKLGATLGDVLEPETAGDTLAPEAAGDTLAPEAAGDTLAPETAGDTLAPEAAGDTLAPEAADDVLAPETAVTEAELKIEVGFPLPLGLVVKVEFETPVGFPLALLPVDVAVEVVVVAPERGDGKRVPQLDGIAFGGRAPSAAKTTSS